MMCVPAPRPGVCTRGFCRSALIDISPSPVLSNMARRSLKDTWWLVGTGSARGPAGGAENVVCAPAPPPGVCTTGFCRVALVCVSPSPVRSNMARRSLKDRPWLGPEAEEVVVVCVEGWRAMVVGVVVVFVVIVVECFYPSLLSSTLPRVPSFHFLGGGPEESGTQVCLSPESTRCPIREGRPPRTHAPFRQTPAPPSVPSAAPASPAASARWATTSSLPVTEWKASRSHGARASQATRASREVLREWKT